MSAPDPRRDLPNGLSIDPAKFVATLEVMGQEILQQERDDWARADIWLERFGPRLEEIAAKHDESVDRVRTYAQKRVRGRVATIRRAVRDDVDALIQKYPLWGDWYVAPTAPCTVRLTFTCERSAVVHMVCEAPNPMKGATPEITHPEAHVTASGDRDIYEVVTEARPGSLLVVICEDRGQRDEYQQRLDQWIAAQPEGRRWDWDSHPAAPPSRNVTYLLTPSRELRLLSDVDEHQDEQKAPNYYDYLRRAVSLAELLVQAQERGQIGNRTGDHSAVVVGQE